jgi:hypothetical protein
MAGTETATIARKESLINFQKNAKIVMVSDSISEQYFTCRCC